MYLNIGPSPPPPTPYIHLTSTHVMNAPRPSLFFAGLPPPYMQMEGKNRKALEQGPLYQETWQLQPRHRLEDKCWLFGIRHTHYYQTTCLLPILKLLFPVIRSFLFIHTMYPRHQLCSFVPDKDCEIAVETLLIEISLVQSPSTINRLIAARTMTFLTTRTVRLIDEIFSHS